MSRRRALNTGYGAERGPVAPASRTSKTKTKTKESIYELKETMNYIKYEWPQVLEEDANPIELAISLLDDSSVGLSHKMSEFEEMSENTTTALRRVVNDHYDIFNTSIGSYHYLLTTSRDNQKDANEIKQMLESTTKEIHNKSDILQELNQTSVRYSEMIEILDAMEYMNSIPDKIDQLILDKKIHQVYDIISQGYTTAATYNLWNLSAMTSIKNYLDLQSNNLFDMIIDELQNEIYLKSSVVVQESSPWDMLITSNNNPKLAGFKTFVTKSSRLEEFIYNSANLDLAEISECFNELINDFVSNQLPELLKTTSSNLNLTFDLSGSFKNYHYIYQLLMTAQKLNRLMPAITILTQSNQQEFHGLLYRTIEEIKSKNMHELNKLKKILDFESEFEDELTSFHDYSVKILKDLFSSVFVKALMVLQKQKLISEIVAKFDLTYDFKTSWTVVKNELSSLILNYISTDSELVVHKNKLAMNELFKLDNVKFNKEQLMTKFPNLIEGSEEFGNYQTDFFIKNEAFQSNLEVLVPVNIFNMRIIIDFFLIFVSSMINLMSTDPSRPINQTAVQFFENFMKISFLPKLRDNFDSKFNMIMGAFEDDNVDELNTNRAPAFKTDLMNLNNSMIYQNAFEFKKFFISLCYTLNTSLTYRQELNNLVLQFLRKFHILYSNFYKGLMGNTNTKLNSWLKTPALNDLSSLIINETGEVNHQLVEKEIEIMLLNDEMLEVTKDELFDNESLQQLCYLLLTSSWILSWLPNFRKESNYNYEEDLTLIEKLKHDWNFLENGKRVINDTSSNSNQANLNSSIDNLNVYLSLNSAKFKEFNDVISNFEKIRLHSLIVLRYELRLKSIFYITRSFKETDWVLNSEPGDSDQFVSRYNKEIFAMENRLNNYLSETEMSRIFVGMSSFLDELLIKGSKLIHKINNNGIKKLLVNIFTLSQMLKNLNKSNLEIDFKRSSYYFELFTINENQFPSKLSGYDESEKANLVRLLYSEKLADGNGSSFNISKYNDLLAKVK
ncbi:exocyst subunit [Yamadazyma tenuis]|uniref:Exocyst complex component Sec8 n=1 Tax=Candida tenuis (strain ATCC 10573 / BCRC 21748 / CBS 615 / JCM 9827 / NBRC 10315 / NRRL Y-1498 / VKM Y-70) TaxID=590646 RepID=G3B3L1_CANTC|nr:uncharacterized protein CANTEDRAFT_93698 [Yamadazyma tenuis ATCC 10573]EGV64180.1 hypothetical protein CANTEDRAFT_93698 [Yamadazyma tenuis ATCC 10573]WEJ96162.1 exocyst subunit [Yamadazyma tenuis]